MKVPDHLVKPSCEGHLYGKLTYNKRQNSYYVDGEPAMLELAKRVFPGSRTDFSGRSHNVRFKATARSVENLNWLMLRFPLEVDCWATLNQDREKAIAQAHRRVTNSKLEPVDPPKTFLAELFDFQKAGVSYLIKNERTCLADQTGLGKTFTALGAVASVNQFPVLIVPQAHLRLQWQRVIGHLFEVPGIDNPKVRGRELVHIVKGLKPYKLPKKPFYICHYGLLRGWRDILPEFGFKVLIFDEVQELRHTGTQKYSTATEISQDTEFVWALSGTPIYNYGSEIWSVMNAIDYHCLSDFESFTREWCSGYGTKVVTKPAVLGDYLKREGLMIRHRKKDVFDQIPDVLRMVQVVDKDDDVYNKLVVEAVKVANRYHNIKEWNERGKAITFVERESRRATGVAKAPFVAEFVKTLVDGGEKVLLFAWHHDVHDEYESRLKKYGLVKMTGRQSSIEKELALDSFMKGRANIALMSLRTAAGLDGLQEQATCIVFGELDWSPAVHCVDEKTEILTVDGFRGVDGVSVGDMVAGFDVDDGSIRFVSALHKVDRLMTPDEVMYRTDSKKIDLAVTGEHQMVYRSLIRSIRGNKKTQWRVAKARDLSGKKRRYIPTCGLEKAKGVPLSDDELRFIGLFVSDGNLSVSGNTLTIYQSVNSKYNTEIVRILRGANITWSLFVRTDTKCSDMNWYTVPLGVRPKWTIGEVNTLHEMVVLGAPNKEIAARIGRTTQAVYDKKRKMRKGILTHPVEEKSKGWLKLAPYMDKDLSPLLQDVTTHQLDCLVQGIWIGDGVKNYVNVLRISNTNKTMLDRLQSLCVRRGRTAIVRELKRRTSAWSRIYNIHISDRSEAYLQDDKRHESMFKPDDISTSERVWCVENEMGTIVVRRNGKVAVVGNCQCEARIERIGVNESLDSIMSYYCVADTGYDEVMQEALGLKVAQFTLMMHDSVETEEDKVLAQRKAKDTIERIIDKLRTKVEPLVVQPPPPWEVWDCFKVS